MDGNSIILFLVSVFCLLAYRNYKKCGFTLAIILYILYVLSLLSSLAIGFIIPGYTDNVLLIPSAYLLVILPFWFNGFHCKVNIIYDPVVDYKFAKTMVWIMMPVFLYFLYYFIKLYYSGLIQTADNIRDDLGETNFLPGNTITSIAILISQLYFINIFLFFLGLVVGWSDRLNLLLMISSLSFPLYCLCFFGRDGLVLWIFNIAILFILLRKKINEKTRRRISTILISIVGVGFLGIAYISVYRFFGRIGFSDEYIWHGTLGYFGQQIGNFSDMFYGDYEYVSTFFPGFRGMVSNLLGIEIPTYRDMLVRNGQNEEIGVFCFFTQILVSGYGYFGGLIFSIIFYQIICNLSSKLNQKQNTYYFIIIYTLYQIPMNGVFYYRQGVSRGDIAFALGFIILYYIYKRKKQYG